jgi:pimeloyl-ACP methyl ester carboxylesterase
VQAYNVQRTKITNEAYQRIPPTYLICENDQAVPLGFQETFAKLANARVARCNSGHSPQLSQPDYLVDHIVSTMEQQCALLAAA